jgi:adenosylhomocysteine nucleosidase
MGNGALSQLEAWQRDQRPSRHVTAESVLGVVTGLTSEAKLLKGLDLACVSTGGKAHIARAKIARLIDRGATGLISFGIAGAISPGLVHGDLIIADGVVAENGERWPTHGPWFDAVLAEISPLRKRSDDVAHSAASMRAEGHFTSDRHPGLAPGSIPQEHERGDSGPRGKAGVTVGVGRGGSATAPRDPSMPLTGTGLILGHDTILGTVEQKIAAYNATGALTVDMESHHVARAAADHGLPFLAIRAVSDAAGDVLPAVMASFVDEFGQTKMSAVLRALISGRINLGELLAAGRASKRAHQSLFRCRRAIATLQQ